MSLQADPEQKRPLALENVNNLNTASGPQLEN